MKESCSSLRKIGRAGESRKWDRGGWVVGGWFLGGGFGVGWLGGFFGVGGGGVGEVGCCGLGFGLWVGAVVWFLGCFVVLWGFLFLFCFLCVLGGGCRLRRRDLGFVGLVGGVGVGGGWVGLRLEGLGFGVEGGCGGGLWVGGFFIWGGFGVRRGKGGGVGSELCGGGEAFEWWGGGVGIGLVRGGGGGGFGWQFF